MHTKGVHLICELSGCSAQVLNDCEKVRQEIYGAAQTAGAKVLNAFLHPFKPQGVTGFLCLAESHLSIHTWPEHGYAAIDIYTCGQNTVPQLAIQALEKSLGATSSKVRRIERGLVTEAGTYFSEMSDNLETATELMHTNDSQQANQHLKVDRSGIWFDDDCDPNERHYMRVGRMLYSKQTEFQEVTILDNPTYGKVLFLDKASQSAQNDEYIYHETLVHPGMLLHPHPRDVLILGGGEGASLREVLRHRSVREAVMVDIDGELVEACKTYLPEWADGAYQDPRATLVIENGQTWVERCTRQFDAIIMDLTDQIDLGPSFPLYTQAFFKTLQSRLRPNGMLIVQAGGLSTVDNFSHCAIRKTLQSVFPFIQSYAQFVPSFFSDWSFILASRLPITYSEMESRLDREIRERLTKPTRFYGPAGHIRMFALPKDLEEILGQTGVVVTNRNDFMVHLEAVGCIEAQ